MYFRSEQKSGEITILTGNFKGNYKTNFIGAGCSKVAFELVGTNKAVVVPNSDFESNQFNLNNRLIKENYWKIMEKELKVSSLLTKNNLLNPNYEKVKIQIGKFIIKALLSDNFHKIPNLIVLDLNKSPDKDSLIKFYKNYFKVRENGLDLTLWKNLLSEYFIDCIIMSSLNISSIGDSFNLAIDTKNNKIRYYGFDFTGNEVIFDLKNIKNQILIDSYLTRVVEEILFGLTWTFVNEDVISPKEEFDIDLTTMVENLKSSFH